LLTLFCSPMLSTGRCGGMIPMVAILFVVRIKFLPPEDTSNLIWHKQVPLKVSVIAWRLLRNRFSTKDNLVRRHIIPPDASICTGCGGAETAHHFSRRFSSTTLFHAAALGVLYLGGLA
jgi:hypothetical protein